MSKRVPYKNGPGTRFGDKGVPIALHHLAKDKQGKVTARYSGILLGKMIDVAVSNIDFSWAPDHIPLFFSEMWVDAVVAKAAALPYAGSQVARGVGTVWFMATIDGTPHEVVLKGLPRLTENQLEDTFRNATAAVLWTDMSGTRTPSVQRQPYELPTFKGYTIDYRLRQFRKADPGKALEFIDFSSAKGESILQDMAASETGIQPGEWGVINPDWGYHIEVRGNLRGDWQRASAPVPVKVLQYRLEKMADSVLVQYEDGKRGTTDIRGLAPKGKTYETFKCPLCGMESRVNKFGDILDTKVRQWHPYIAKVDSMVCAKSNPSPMRVDLLGKETLEKIKVRGKETGAGRVPQTEAICPICGGPGMSMGILGRKQFFRCRNCGIEWSLDAIYKRSPQTESKGGSVMDYAKIAMDILDHPMLFDLDEDGYEYPPHVRPPTWKVIAQSEGLSETEVRKVLEVMGQKYFLSDARTWGTKYSAPRTFERNLEEITKLVKMNRWPPRERPRDMGHQPAPHTPGAPRWYGMTETHSLKQLQDMARAKGVSPAGTKKTLISRLGLRSGG